MELKEFIRTAITDIVNAVIDAQGEVGEVATVMPVRSKAFQPFDIAIEGGHKQITNIDFDVAVTVSSKEGAEGNAGGGIQIAGMFNFGVKHQENAENVTQSISRMKFSIPIVLPHCFVSDELVKGHKDGRIGEYPRKALDKK